MQILPHRSKLFERRAAQPPASPDQLRVFMEPELVPFFAWLLPEMSRAGVDWSRPGAALDEFLASLAASAEPMAAAAASAGQVKRAADALLEEPDAPVEVAPQPPPVSPPAQDKSIRKIFPSDVIEFVSRQPALRRLLEDTKLLVTAVYIFVYWHEQGVGPTLKDIMAFLGSHGLVGQDPKQGSAWEVVYELTLLHVVTVVSDEAATKRSPGTITPIYGALGAEDPWAMLCHLIDQGVVTEDQVRAAAQNPMDKDAEEKVLAQVRSGQASGVPVQATE